VRNKPSPLTENQSLTSVGCRITEKQFRTNRSNFVGISMDLTRVYPAISSDLR
jgi:hypothetical protein